MWWKLRQWPCDSCPKTQNRALLELARLVTERGYTIARLQNRLRRRRRTYAVLHREIKRLREILREHGIET